MPASLAALLPRRARGGRAAQGGRARARPVARRRPPRRDAGEPSAPRSARSTASAAAAAPDVVLHLRAVRQARPRGRVHGRAASRASTRSGGLRAGTRRTSSASARRCSPCTSSPARRGRSPAPATTRSSATRPGLRTAYYVFEGRLWGFGLFRSRRLSLPMSIGLGGRRARRAATRRRRAPHAGPHLADARRADRRARPREGGVLPARRRLQVPRRVQQDLVARRGRAAARRPRLLVRQPRAGRRHRRGASSARARRSSCPRTRRPRSSTRRAATAPRSCRTTAGRRAARRSAPGSRRSAGSRSSSPYDDPLVMAGQGTVALELLEDAPELDLLLVPISGGGLIAGCATVGEGAAAGDPSRRSRARGRRRHAPFPRRRRARSTSTSRATIADGLQATEPGELTFEVNRRLRRRGRDRDRRGDRRGDGFLFDRLKLVAEPSGAVGIAALLSGKLDPRGRPSASCSRAATSAPPASPSCVCRRLLRGRPG